MQLLQEISIQWRPLKGKQCIISKSQRRPLLGMFMIFAPGKDLCRSLLCDFDLREPSSEALMLYFALNDICIDDVMVFRCQ